MDTLALIEQTKNDAYEMLSELQSKEEKVMIRFEFKWGWAFAIAAVLATSQCASQVNRAKIEAEAIRHCIVTAAKVMGTATPEQINACNKAAGRG